MPASVSPAKKSANAPHVIVPPKAAPSGVPKKKPKGTTVKTPPQSRKAKGNGATVGDQQRRNYVEVAAYYIAERRGFHGGSELEDWAQAEREVERLLRENRLNP